MQKLLDLVDRVPWRVIAVACLTLGLAPFMPEPHVVEKLRMLATGSMQRAVDVFDLLMHGVPFLLAALKFAAGRRQPRGA